MSLENNRHLTYNVTVDNRHRALLTYNGETRELPEVKYVDSYGAVQMAYVIRPRDLYTYIKRALSTKDDYSAQRSDLEKLWVSPFYSSFIQGYIQVSAYYLKLLLDEVETGRVKLDEEGRIKTTSINAFAARIQKATGVDLFKKQWHRGASADVASVQIINPSGSRVAFTEMRLNRDLETIRHLIVRLEQELTTLQGGVQESVETAWFTRIQKAISDGEAKYSDRMGVCEGIYELAKKSSMEGLLWYVGAEHAEELTEQHDTGLGFLLYNTTAYTMYLSRFSDKDLEKLYSILKEADQEIQKVLDKQGKLIEKKVNNELAHLNLFTRNTFNSFK